MSGNKRYCQLIGLRVLFTTHLQKISTILRENPLKQKRKCRHGKQWNDQTRNPSDQQRKGFRCSVRLPNRSSERRSCSLAPFFFFNPRLKSDDHSRAGGTLTLSDTCQAKQSYSRSCQKAPSFESPNACTIHYLQQLNSLDPATSSRDPLQCPLTL